MTILSARERPGQARHRLRAFTLVELMVAVTGGLFISVIVFAMARQGTRFYQQETRIAEATLAATIGMQRLRADIGRAGYMVSPNIVTDAANSKLCMTVAAFGNRPLLQQLRSVKISQETDARITNNSDLKLGATSPIIPDRIVLAGAYQSADRFITGYLPQNPGSGATSIPITLQPGIGALVRYGYPKLDAGAQGNLLSSLFPIGRALRLVNQYGKIAYAVIVSTSASGGPSGNLPVVNISADPLIPLRGGTSQLCEFAGVGVEINVVNFIRYRIADVKGEAADKTLFGQLYASTDNPWDANRTELIREELDPTTGSPFTQTDVNNNTTQLPPEIISEYAVDLKFEITYASPWPNPLQLLTTSPTTTNTVYTLVGDDTNNQAQTVRGIRTRLSVRSREADRGKPIPGTGLYRLGITANGVTSYARVRTLQADVTLANHF